MWQAEEQPGRSTGLAARPPSSPVLLGHPTANRRVDRYQVGVHMVWWEVTIFEECYKDWAIKVWTLFFSNWNQLDATYFQKIRSDIQDRF